jgi:hypothetical protein
MKFGILMAALAAGCGGAGTLEPIDLSHGNRDMALPLQPGGSQDMAQAPSSQPDMAMAPQNQNTCTTYTPSSIATMRKAATSGCFELDNVVTLAATYVGSTTKSVTFHVQDSGGGDYSAVQLLCSSTSTSHPCTAFSNAKNILVGRQVTVQGTYIKSSATKGGYEAFEIDSISDSGSGTAPSPAPLAEADLERGATMSAGGKPMAAYWFQIVSANVTDKLVMFDWSPPEFARSGGGTTCPLWFGFGMIPASAGASAGQSCNGGTTQPMGQTTVNPKEVLISTDYFTGFNYTTDCACNTHSDPEPTSGQGTTGAIKAILDYDVPYGSTTGYQYLAPLMAADFTIKN